MLPFLQWFTRRSGVASASGESAPARPDLLEEAHALLREGKQQEASDVYWKIRRKHRTVASLTEHAELLLELGDLFGAASPAGDALGLEPGNARARAIQDRIRRLDDADRRRRQG